MALMVNHARVARQAAVRNSSSRQKPTLPESANIDPNIDAQTVSLKIVALVKYFLTPDEMHFFSKLIKSMQSSSDMPNLAEHMSKQMDPNSDLCKSIFFCLKRIKKEHTSTMWMKNK
jgi:hypothetical protein